MILQCPSCTARFAVPDALIPPEGRTVKCGRCAHQWHAEGIAAPEPLPDFAALAEQAMESAPVNPAQLPVPQKPPIPAKPFVLVAIGLLVAWLLLAFVAYYPKWLPAAAPLYRLMGVSTTDGLVFQDVSMQRNTDGAKTQFILTGSIANQSASSRTVPTVRVQLKDKHGKIMWAREYVVNEKLDAGAVYPFRIDNVETTFAGSVSSITLDLGHKLQMMMR